MNVYWEITVVLLSVAVCMIAVKLWRVNNHLCSREENTVHVLDKHDVRLRSLESESEKYRVWKKWQSESIDGFSSKAEKLENEMIDLTTRHNNFKRIIMDAICDVIRDVHDIKKMAYTTSVTVDPDKLKVLTKIPGGVIREENKQAPVVHRFYPCIVTHRADSENFCWNYFSKSNAYFMQGGDLPNGFDEKPCNVSLDCTVEVLEYPDGRYSAAWFPGEFRAETSPDAQSCP